MKILMILLFSIFVGMLILSFFFKDKMKELCLLVFSITISLSLIEVYFHLFSPQTHEHDDLFKYDQNLGWVFNGNKIANISYPDIPPHFVKTNSLGFRDNEIDLSSKNSTRILFLGDSFVSNIAVEDESVFTEVLQRKLNNVEVINFGVNGYGQVQQYLQLTKWWDRVKPDAVFLVIYLQNDFTDNIDSQWIYARPYASLDHNTNAITFHHSSKNIRSPPLFKKFIYRSHTFSLINRIAARFSDYGITNNAYILPEYYLCNAKLKENYGTAQLVMEKIIVQINDFLVDKNVPLTLVVAPSSIQINDNLWKYILKKAGENSSSYSRTLPNDIILEIGKRHNIRIIDLYPALYKLNKQKPLYNTYEQHWNEVGNQVVAKVILEDIERNNSINSLLE